MRTQLKSGHEFIVGPELREEIASYKSRLCKPSELLHYELGRIISVGDVTTDVLHKNGITPFVEVVDLKTKRGPEGAFKSIPGSIRVTNPPGSLSHELFLAIERLIRGNGGRIEVDGEEDLAVIPIIFYSDINTVVAYGIPDVGMACIQVDQSIKDSVKLIIERMEDRCRN